MSSHFQITTNSGDYSAPIVDVRRDWINIYGDTGAPDYKMVDLNKEIKLTELTVNKLSSAGKLYWRVRYRDQNLIWSQWSSEQSFNIEPSGSLSDDVAKNNQQ